MCTLSFVPRVEGYGVGMNRDELRLRERALFPQIYQREQILAAYPSEPEGGPWIAVNGFGMLLALLNWNLGNSCIATRKQRSRGELIPELIFREGLASVETVMRRRHLEGILPFRLVGIDPEARAIREWRWDGAKVVVFGFPWNRKHWFSSSLSDRAAAEQRAAACAAVSLSGKPEDSGLLRDLHRSHRSAAGAYSLCVHRPDAATVSYTEVLYDTHRISMSYIDGSPCESIGLHHVLEMPRSFGRLSYARSAAPVF